MDYSRRHAIQAIGTGAAALSVACASADPGEDTSVAGASANQESEAVKRSSHKVAIRKCGHYVVVESTTPGSPHSFRGKLEAWWEDDVTIHNRTGGIVKLVLPEPQIFKGQVDEIVKLNPGDQKDLSFAAGQGEGRYEYGVLYEKKELSGTEGRDLSEWAFAVGGSSSVFIIRRPPGP
jgi:hypothetical protein